MALPPSDPACPAALPTPDAAARAHSARLAERLCTEAAAAGGRLPFDHFMELALYAPGLGYYSAGARKFGPQGDFVTAPEISSLFSRCLARQCEQILAPLDGEVLEVGAGSGVMAADLLAELKRRDALPRRYLILEVSGELRARQRVTLEARVPGLAERVVWLERLPERFVGVVLANEVVDAMPVQRFCIEGGAVRERLVACREGRFVWESGEPQARLAERVAALRREYGLAEGYASEVNFRAEDWLRAVAGALERGVALIIDYGFPAREYYHPERRDGTLMCHYRHRAHGDPLILPGLQDITAHVDFTALADAAAAAGLAVLGFTNQANFLLGNGLLEMVGGAPSAAAQFALATEVKRLTMPSEMGELFKVLAVGRGVDSPLNGFALRDDRARL